MAKAIELPFGADYDVAFCVSRRQALFLATLFSMIGGDEKKSHRKESSEMMKALEEIGIHWDNEECREFKKEGELSGSILCRDLSPKHSNLYKNWYK